MTTNFTTIPLYPRYEINALGQVRVAQSGYVLSHDDQGRVKLKVGKNKMSRFFIGELLAFAKIKITAPTGLVVDCDNCPFG